MNESRMPVRWYLAQVRPNQFHIACRNLERQEFSIFAPIQDETRRRGGRFVTERRPLFPGYLFVSFDPFSTAWRMINSTHGVSRLVSFGGGVPAPVPTELVVGLISRCDREGLLRQQQALNPGDSVQVLSGPFANFVGTVEKLAPHQRVWLLVEIMGSPTRASFDAAQLRLS